MKKTDTPVTERNTEPCTELMDDQSTLKYVLDIVREGIWDWRCDNDHVDHSPGWYNMLELDPSTTESDTAFWHSMIHPDDYDRVIQHLDDYLHQRITSYNIDYRCRKADGNYLWVNDHAKTVAFKPNGSPARIIGSYQDIDQLKAAELLIKKSDQLLRHSHESLERLIQEKTRQLEQKNQQLEEKIDEIEQISNIDSLTRIANRKKFEIEVKNEVGRCKRYQHPLSLIIFDIDWFKKINDSYGHTTGDQVLVELAQLVTHYIRSADFFARWGGEEFVIIFPNLKAAEAVGAAEKLRHLIEHHTFAEHLSLTCSFGVTEFAHNDDVESFFCRADNALYMAKNSGRNQVASCIAQR